LYDFYPEANCYWLAEPFAAGQLENFSLRLCGIQWPDSFAVGSVCWSSYAVRGSIQPSRRLPNSNIQWMTASLPGGPSDSTHWRLFQL
jgi:hypothetical protein